MPRVSKLIIHPAPIPLRPAALMFDALLLFLTLNIAVPVIFGQILPEGVRGQVMLALFVSIPLLYEPILVSRLGSTLGHYLFKLQVEDIEGGKLHFLKALIRTLIKWTLGWASFITIVFGRQQAIHDHLTGSEVTLKKRTPVPE